MASFGLPLLTSSLLTKIGIIYTQLLLVEKIFPIIPRLSAQPKGAWDTHKKLSEKLGAKFPAISSGKKAQEFWHIYIDSIVNVMSTAFIAPISKIFVIKVAILQLRYQQRHNLSAYIMYIYSILSLQCIIGRFSIVVIFGCFVSGRDFVGVFWSIFLVIKAKQDQSVFLLFNLFCEWFFDLFLGNIEVTGQTGWEWKLHV